MEHLGLGLNTNGQLGDGTNNDRNNPIQVGNANSWQSVSAGYFHTLALKLDGTLWAWGDNFNGQLGDGTNVNKNSPVQIGSANDWQSVAAGFDHSISIKTDGSLSAWGWNINGQLGNGTSNSSNIPLQIGSANDWQDIAVGWNHSLSIKTDGTLWAWGANSYGQLGNGTNNETNSPVQVLCSTTHTDKALNQLIVNLYPNPAKSTLVVELPNINISDFNFEISNLSGQVVVSKQILPNEKQINIATLPRGIYFLTLRKDEKYIIESFIKM